MASGDEETAHAHGIGELQRRYQALHELRIQADTSLKHANAQLEELKKEARENFGTDDMKELQAKLKEMESENARGAGGIPDIVGED